MLVVGKFKDNSIVRQSVSNPEFGSIVVKDNGVKLVNGFLNKNNNVAFIRGKHEELKKLDLKEGMDISTLFGNQKMVVKESTKEFFIGQEPKKNPKTNEICVTTDGEPIYRVTEIVDINSPVTDTLLEKAEVEITIPSTMKHEDIKS